MKGELEQLARAFADQVRSLVQREVDQVVDQVKADLLASLSGKATSPAPVVPPVRRKRRRRRVARPVAVEVETPAPEPLKKPRACRLCREVGHRADRCPNAEQDAAPAEQTTPEVNAAPSIASPPPPSRLDRFSRIEAAARARGGALK